MTTKENIPKPIPQSQKAVIFCSIWHTPDGDRKNGHAMGIVATDGIEAWFWVLDKNTGPYEVCDLSQIFHEMAEADGHDTWIYDEWAEWFRDFLANEARNPVMFQRYVKQLASEGTNLYAVPGWSIAVPDGASSKKILEDLVRKGVPSSDQRQ